jgi:gallate dioxygenase
MWLAMRGALSEKVEKLHAAYYLAMTTTMAVELLEEPAARQGGKRAAAA